MTLSQTLKSEYLARFVGDFASKQHQIQTKSTHLQRLEASLQANNTTTLNLHDQNSNIQAQLTACYAEGVHLKGQKETVELELADIKNNALVRQSILQLINLTDETQQPRLPFETLPLEEVATRLAVHSWEDVDSLSFNAAHRATVVSNVLGLARNGHFKALWTAPSNPEVWLRLFGSEPKVLIGRKASADELKLRLAGYVSIQPPQEVISRVLGDLDGDSSDSLSSVEEGEEGEESDEEIEGPIPRSVDVSSKKRSCSYLEVASEQEIMEELRRRKAASSAGEDKAASSAGEDNNS